MLKRSSAATNFDVVHVGPDIESFGGTQTVIRTIRDNGVGGDRILALPTWAGPQQLQNVRLMAHAARVLSGLTRGTVVHAHISNGGAWMREGPLIAFARSRGLKVVVHLHGFELPEFAIAHSRFVRRALAPAHHIICLSNEAKDTLAPLVGFEKVTVLPNPVAIDYESPPADETPPTALFAGSIEIRKGVDVLVEAWRLLVSDGIDADCRVVGPIFDFTPPKLDRFSVEPAVHPSDIRKLLRAVRVVVLPSRAEAMPMILTEALAAARPFVATPVGGVSDITPTQDMLVPVGDAEALSQAMARYLNNGSLAAAAGHQGQQHIIATRSTELIGRRLREIYAEI